MTRSRAYVVDLQIGVHRDNDPPLLGLKPGHENRCMSLLLISRYRHQAYTYVYISTHLCYVIAMHVGRHVMHVCSGLLACW